MGYKTYYHFVYMNLQLMGLCSIGQLSRKKSYQSKWPTRNFNNCRNYFQPERVPVLGNRQDSTSTVPGTPWHRKVHSSSLISVYKYKVCWFIRLVQIPWTPGTTWYPWYRKVHSSSLISVYKYKVYWFILLVQIPLDSRYCRQYRNWYLVPGTVRGASLVPGTWYHCCTTLWSDGALTETLPSNYTHDRTDTGNTGHILCTWLRHARYIHT